MVLILAKNFLVPGSSGIIHLTSCLYTVKIEGARLAHGAMSDAMGSNAGRGPSVAIEGDPAPVLNKCTGARGSTLPGVNGMISAARGRSGAVSGIANTAVGAPMRSAPAAIRSAAYEAPSTNHHKVRRFLIATRCLPNSTIRRMPAARRRDALGRFAGPKRRYGSGHHVG